MSKPPAGIFPIYLRAQMVEQYGMMKDGDPKLYVKIPKAKILADVAEQGVFNDFSDVNLFKKIKAIPMDEILFIGDPDGKYDGSNFLTCLTVKSAADQWAVRHPPFSV